MLVTWVFFSQLEASGLLRNSHCKSCRIFFVSELCFYVQIKIMEFLVRIQFLIIYENQTYFPLNPWKVFEIYHHLSYYPQFLEGLFRRFINHLGGGWGIFQICNMCTKRLSQESERISFSGIIFLFQAEVSL